MMTLDMAVWVVGAFATYAALGLAFALAFITLGAQRIDPAAQGMPWTARLLLLPGAAALWPLLLVKWLAGRQPPVS